MFGWSVLVRRRTRLFAWSANTADEAYRRGAVSIIMPTPVPTSAPDTGWPVARPTPVPMSPPAMVAHPETAVTTTKTARNFIVRIIAEPSANVESHRVIGCGQV